MRASTWRGAGDIALDHGQMLGLGQRVHVHHDAPGASVELIGYAFMHAADEVLAGAAMGNQVGDGAELQAMALGEGDQVWQGRAMLPSSFMISQMTPAGSRPAMVEISTAAFGMAGADQRARRGARPAERRGRG